MVSARITCTWPDGNTTRLAIEIDSPAFPDALDEARMQVVRMYRDVMADLDELEPEPEVEVDTEHGH